MGNMDSNGSQSKFFPIRVDGIDPVVGGNDPGAVVDGDTGWRAHGFAWA